MKPPEPTTETVKCCHDACILSAKVKVKTSTGWANFCMRHYDGYHARHSENYCNALGLTTTESRIAWLKKHAAGITKRYTQNIPTTREPGSDFEEDEWRESAA